MEWLKNHESLSVAILTFSILLSVGGILAAPIIVTYVPDDYFLEGAPHRDAWHARHPLVRWSWHIAKNVLGVLLVITGIIMALPMVPGPGVLTVLLGLSLVDFPGKRRLERKIVGQPRVLKQINALRAKAGQSPLRV